MLAKIIRAIVAILIMTLLTVLLLEGVLWFIDPMGIATYVTDLSSMVTIANAEGFTLPPGRHDLRYWSYTVNESGDRIMPPSDGACTLAFVGDSLTFGQGVNDMDTFAYRIAQQYPDVRFLNLAKIAYNIGNVRTVVESHPAEGYIYYIADNDDGLSWARPESEWGQPRELPPRLSALRYYVATLQEMNAPAITDPDGFWRDFDALESRGDVLMFAMGSTLADDIQAREPDITVIPRWSVDLKVSWIDWHPNPAGHQYLIDAMQPEIAAFVASRCSM